mmetsp:Transcript_12598/g.32218  ORF Transcript_12598/g.32218 Transcript_12598/m.32218 type:complete len:223 (+) Transcript_12598:46-714(+)
MNGPDGDDEASDQLYKVLVIGDYGVGKTSVIRRYTEGFFTPNYKLTIGVDFALKNIDWEDGSKISLQLWDIAGHERFGHMTHVYYKYAIAAIIVFDLGRPPTFESVVKWQKDLNEKVMLANEEPVPTILLANKCDMSHDVDKEKLDQFCKDNGFLAWFATSAKINKNIDEAMHFLTEEILKVAQANQQPIQPENVLSIGSDKKKMTFQERLKAGAGKCGCDS